MVVILLGTTDLLPRAAAASAPLEGPSSANITATSAPSLAQTPTTTQSQESEYDFSNILEVESVSGMAVSKNFEAGRFSDAVVIEPKLRNTSGKTIVGIRGTVFVLDGFGREIDSFNFKDSDKLATNSHTSGGYRYEDNQFIDDEHYDKLAPVVSGGTAKYRVKIKEVAFEDGSTLPTSN
jgi:hypothetical protein